MKVTIYDVAKLAGVSPKTVSNVINDFAHVSAKTRLSVQAAIEELGYVANPRARSLRSGRTGLIGVAVPSVSNPYFAFIVEQLAAEAEELGLTILVERTGGRKDRERQALTGERRMHTDGLIISPISMTNAEIKALDPKYPLVILGESDDFVDFDYVAIDNRNAISASVDYLVSQGARRIAVAGGGFTPDNRSSTIRTQAYLEALARHGIAADPALIVSGYGWTRQSGGEAVDFLIANGTTFDALIGLNDELALGALYSLHRNGVKVPEQVLVMGFDDVTESALAYPPMTSIEPGKVDIADTALRFLLARMNGSSEGPKKHIARFSIAERQSTRR